jgi:hypothetical protein
MGCWSSSNILELDYVKKNKNKNSRDLRVYRLFQNTITGSTSIWYHSDAIADNGYSAGTKTWDGFPADG